MPAKALTLNCWVRAEDVAGIFQVKISKTETIAALREAIKTKKSVTFRDVDANTLPLYKPRDPLSDPYEEKLNKFVLSKHGELLEMGDDELSGVFRRAPPKHQIHIIVDAPSAITWWLRGNTLDARLHIPIRPDTNAGECINQLTCRIRDAQPDLRDMAITDIRLYRISGDEKQLQQSLYKAGDGELLQSGTLLSYFLSVPVLDPLCVCADVISGTVEGHGTVGKGKQRVDSDLPYGEKRHHFPSDNIAEFHSEIWAKGPHAHAAVFVTMPVEQPQLSGVEVPDQCCVMKSPPYGSGSKDLSGIFIRHEFVLAVRNIIAFYKGEIFVNDEVGIMTETSVNAESSMAQTQFPVTIDNPFLDVDFPLHRTNNGVIITGAPGIGKSTLLEFILHLRNLAGRPTIYVRDQERVDLFTFHGVSRMKQSRISRSSLPPSVWVLVDSNRDLICVPQWVSRLDCFIVQAASPGWDRLEWEEEIGVSRYVMKMWSLEEVLAARMLQRLAFPPSETQLQTFFERYAPSSARTAYSFGPHIWEFDSEVRAAIDNLSLNDVGKMVYNTASLGLDTEIPHRLFHIQPGKTRSSFSLEFASGYIFNMLVTILSRKAANAARVLFEVYNRNSDTKVFAGQLLEAVIRGDFRRAGEWRIHQMGVSATKGHYPAQYLIVGDRTKPIVRISDERPDNDGAFPCFPFDPAIRQVTKTGYYLPTAKNEGMFDAFYYDADRKEATILQATVSTHHSVKTQVGLERLREVGVESARYVAVAGIQEEFDCPVPTAYDGGFLKEKYHLVLT